MNSSCSPSEQLLSVPLNFNNVLKLPNENQTGFSGAVNAMYQVSDQGTADLQLQRVFLYSPITEDVRVALKSAVGF